MRSKSHQTLSALHLRVQAVEERSRGTLLESADLTCSGSGPLTRRQTCRNCASEIHADGYLLGRLKVHKGSESLDLAVGSALCKLPVNVPQPTAILSRPLCGCKRAGWKALVVPRPTLVPVPHVAHCKWTCPHGLRCFVSDLL